MHFLFTSYFKFHVRAIAQQGRFRVLNLNSNTFFWKTLLGPGLKFTYQSKDSTAEKGMEIMKAKMAEIRMQNT